MQKIKNNLTAIQQKFQSLKKTHSHFQEATSIGQVAEVMTYGVVTNAEVQDYLSFVSKNQQVQQQRLNDKWSELNINQMIVFFDKVIKYRNMPKQQLIERKGFEKFQIQSLTLKQEENKQQQIMDLNRQPIKAQSAFKQNKKININGKQTVAQILDLSQDFLNFPIEERHQMLIDKYKEVRNQLQAKFTKIYGHYRKQMYIPNQSFQKNNELMVDMRLFLKYYRQFQMGKYYKVNMVSNLFKKIAINGLWLDFEKFVQIHYQVLQLLKTINLKSNKQQNEQIDKTQKQQLNASIKALISNLVKLKGMTKVISDKKINKIMNKTKIQMSSVKKMVQAHSGITKQDVILKLNERIQERKSKKQLLFKQRIKGVNTQQACSSQRNSPLKRVPGQLSYQKSIYSELQLPKLRSRDLKKTSVYSSLQQLIIHKQKQRLKNIVNEQQKQKYLELYFSKQKKSQLKRNNSMIFEMSRSQLKRDLPRNSSLKNSPLYSMSLPRMKIK